MWRMWALVVVLVVCAQAQTPSAYRWTLELPRTPCDDATCNEYDVVGRASGNATSPSHTWT